MAKQVVIDYTPRKYFLPLHNTKKRWIVIVAHRRSGKSTSALNHLQRDALRTPNSRYGYIAPTYKQAKNIAWDILKQYAKSIPGIIFNEVELTAKYPNGSKLTLFGSDSPDSLRGMGFWGVVFDEYSQQPSNIFSEIIRPALTDHQGYAIWLGTPKGKNEFYRLYQFACDNEDWLPLFLTVDDTHILPQSEIDQARKVMTDDEFQQEFYCNWLASVKGAYYTSELAQARIEGRITIVPYDPALLVHTVWDLGVGQNMAVGFYQRNGSEIHLIDYWEGSNTDGLPTAIKNLQIKPYVYGRHFAPHDIQQKEMTTEKTRIETAKALGINFEVIPKLGVDEGIHAGKLMFNRLWIDEIKCSFFLEAIEQYHQEWDENRGCFKDYPYKDWSSHAADQYRYAAVIENEMLNDDYAAAREEVRIEENRQQALTNEFFEE